MNTKPLRYALLALGAMVLLAVPAVTVGQDDEELIKQLSGKAEAPARDAGQWPQVYQKAIDYLLPLMSAENVASRYAYQIKLQDMGGFAARPGAEVEREALAKVMVKTLEQVTMPDVVRNWFVLQLERIGKAESVPVLTKLMDAEDQNLRDYARRALEKNPDAIATDALLKALSAAKAAPWRIGLINSLGMRKAEAAVASISQGLSDPDARVAGAAAGALARIGGPQSSKALFAVLEKPAGAVSTAAAQGLVSIAQDQRTRKDMAAAGQTYWALYEQVNRPGVTLPASIRIAAITGLILCSSEQAASQIPAWIRDGDPKVRTAVVQAARTAPSNAPSQLLAGLLPQLAPDTQVQVLTLVGDRKDTQSVIAAKEAMKSSDEAVCLAAIEALGQIGTRTGIEALLGAAQGDSQKAQKTAMAALASMPGAEVEGVVKFQAASGDVKARAVAIGLLGQRRVPDAAKVLLTYAAEPDEKIVVAAYQALVYVADAVDLRGLVAVVATTKTAREQGIAAIKATLSNAKDREAAGQVVLATTAGKDLETRAAMLTCLSTAGGAAAFKAVAEATQSPDAVLRRAGIQTLENWPDFEAAQPLMAIAIRPDAPLEEHVLATRAALTLVETCVDAPLDNRVEVCLSAYDHARRDEEKRNAISKMGTLASQKILERLTTVMQEGPFRTEAGLAAISAARLSMRTDRTTARALIEKVRAMNLSDDVNRQADQALQGGMRGGMRGGTRGGMRGTQDGARRSG